MPIKYIVSTLLLIFLCACAPSRLVEPLSEGEKHISASFGGALFDYQGNTIPMPLSSLTTAYGLSDDFTVYGSLHTTAAIYGVLQTELGFVRSIYEFQNQPVSFSIAPAAHFMIDKWEHHSKFYPSVDINIYSHSLGPEILLYAGISNWFELTAKRAHGETQKTRWIPALHTGYIYKPNTISYNLELKYIAPLHSNENIVIKYTSPSDKGAIGIYGSIGWTFK